MHAVYPAHPLCRSRSPARAWRARPPVDEIERRYLESLQNARQYGFRAGKLALTWRIDDRRGTMIFAPYDLAE